MEILTRAMNRSSGRSASNRKGIAKVRTSASVKMSLTSIAYAALGTIVGLIFVIDGWRSASRAGGWLAEPPKIRGLLFILGGGILPTVQVLSTDDKDPWQYMPSLSVFPHSASY